MRLKTPYLFILQAVVLVAVALGASRGGTIAGSAQETAVVRVAPAPPAVPSGTAPAASARPVATAATERQLLDKYCLACHSEKAKAAGVDSARKLAVDALDVNDVARDARTWENVARRLRAGMMPPAGMPRPDPVTYAGMASWVEEELDRKASPHTPAPGLHRLNRTEYANVIRDLLDLSIDPTKYLPSDDSTAGFDNIAGALGLSSTLVEAYVTAAQKISRLAVGAPDDPTLVVYRTKEDTTQDYHIEGLPFGTRGGVLVDHLFPSDGEYSITVTPIFGDNMSPAGFGSVPCERIQILLDNDRLGLMDWNGGGRAPAANCGGRRMAEGESGQAGPEAFFGGEGGNPMRVRFTTTAGVHKVGATFLATQYAPLLDLDRRFMRSTIQTGPTPGYSFFPHVGTIRIEGPYNATKAVDSPSRRRVFVCTPTTPSGASPSAVTAAETACAKRIVTNLATKAFRRPVTALDVDDLMGAYEFGRAEKDFEQGIEMVVARVLASPQFIYRIEEEPAASRPGQAYRINDIDLASRLSFFLWSRGPDEALMEVARQGRLKDPVVLEQQVRRMLQHPNSKALAANFAGQWLNLRGLDGLAPVALIYPDFDDPLRQAMRTEVEMIFDGIVREDRSILDLLDSDYTFVNERLARHYGIPQVTGSQFRRVTLGPDMESRRGLLGKGAFLMTTSKPERTSPVTRGQWVLTNVLGVSPPDPPADVPPLPARAADTRGNAREPTMRERMVDHRVRADCIQCHRLMDPIGFALENFDAVGLWRSLDGGSPVDASGQLFDGTTIDGPVALRKWLTGYSPQFVRVTIEKLLTYALGRGVDYQDMPLVRSIARDVSPNARFSALVMGIVKSPPFQMNSKFEQDGEPAGTTASRAITDGGGQ
jgi:mono/diheme cytochrome c family protein